MCACISIDDIVISILQDQKEKKKQIRREKERELLLSIDALN